MQNTSLLSKNRWLLLVAGLVSVIFLIWFSSRGGGINNPNTDALLNPEAGKSYAALYEIDDLYQDIEQNDDVLESVQKDLLTFGRVTRPELSDGDSKVGFTFKSREQDGDSFVYTGYYYGVGDKIEVRITPHGKGVYTMSVTNLADQTNIDGSLKMNGPRNAYIKTLPVESSRYSIRYFLGNDQIIASFYDGYTSRDIEAVVSSLTKGLGDNFSSDVIFSLNRHGTVTVEQLRQNLVTPIF